MREKIFLSGGQAAQAVVGGIGDKK